MDKMDKISKRFILSCLVISIITLGVGIEDTTDFLFKTEYISTFYKKELTIRFSVLVIIELILIALFIKILRK